MELEEEKHKGTKRKPKCEGKMVNEHVETKAGWTGKEKTQCSPAEGLQSHSRCCTRTWGKVCNQYQIPQLEGSSPRKVRQAWPWLYSIEGQLLDS